MIAETLLLTAGTIYTMDPARPRVRHLAVADGRIVACGDLSVDDLAGPRTRILRLRGQGGRAEVRRRPRGCGPAASGAFEPRRALAVAEYRRGTLANGMDADLVVLTPDPFPRPPDVLLDTRVALTMVGGRITFSDGVCLP